MPQIQHVQYGTRVKYNNYIGELVDYRNLKDNAPEPRNPFSEDTDPDSIFILLDNRSTTYYWSPYYKIESGSYVKILGEELKEPEEVQAHKNACPKCGCIGHWVSLILKCESCFHTW